MDSVTVRERTAGMIIGSALILKTSLGEEAPQVIDLLDVEVPRILSIPHIFKYVPEYKYISSSIARDIQAVPWERHRDLEALLREWADEVSSSELFAAQDVVDIIEEYAFSSDISTFTIIRQGLQPITDANMMMEFIDESCDILGIDIDMVYLMVMDIYNSVFTQIALR
jgi:hypothetical protein